MHGPMKWMVLVLALMLAACNTVKGVGQDLRKAGEKIEEAARKN